MSQKQRETSEKLVQVHKARDEWEANIVIGYLRDNDVQATYRALPAVPPLDAAESLSGSDRVNGVLVLEHDREKAKRLLDEFYATATDQAVLEETAAQKLKLSKETISQLRGALREERRTFEFLGWLAVVFLGSTALLWAIWPAWLKIEAPAPQFRWVVVIMLALAAVFAGSWASKHMR